MPVEEETPVETPVQIKPNPTNPGSIDLDQTADEQLKNWAGGHQDKDQDKDKK